MKQKKASHIILRIVYWVLLVFCAFMTVGTLLFFVPVWSDVASNLFIPLYGYILLACILLAAIAYYALCKEKSLRTIIHFIASMLLVINMVLMSIWLVHTVNKQGAKIDYLKAFSIQRSDDVQREDLNYTDQNGEEKALSVFYCEDGAQNKPVMFYIHGGGWIWGSREDRLSTTETFAQSGYVVVCADYDLSGEQEHLYAKTEQQLLYAVNWVKENVQTWNADAQKLFFTGDSAGGNLALDIAYKINNGSYDAYTAVKAVSVIYPVTDIRAFYENNNLITSASCKKMAVSYLGATPEQEPERYEQFNPQNAISEKTPPTLIVAAGMDSTVPEESEFEFAQALAERNIAVKYISVPFANHAVDWQANNFLGQAYINNTIEWFARQ